MLSSATVVIVAVSKMLNCATVLIGVMLLRLPTSAAERGRTMFQM